MTMMTDENNTPPMAGSNSLVDLAARINTEHQAVAGAMKRGLEHAINAGKLLTEAKAQLGHGRWLPWLREHCQIPTRTASLYMRLARHADKIGNVADLTVRGAIALLALPRNDDMAAQLAGLADKSLDVAQDFFGFEGHERKDMEAERELQLAMLDEARAAVEKIGKLVNTPDLAEAAEAVSEGIADRFIAACDELRAARYAEMGLTEAEAKEVVASIDELKARGASDAEIAGALVPEFFFDREPLPGPSPTAVVANVRDAAHDWLRRIEQIVAGRAA